MDNFFSFLNNFGNNSNNKNESWNRDTGTKNNINNIKKNELKVIKENNFKNNLSKNIFKTTQESLERNSNINDEIFIEKKGIIEDIFSYKNTSNQIDEFEKKYHFKKLKKSNSIFEKNTIVKSNKSIKNDFLYNQVIEQDKNKKNLFRLNSNLLKSKKKIQIILENDILDNITTEKNINNNKFSKYKFQEIILIYKEKRKNILEIIKNQDKCKNKLKYNKQIYLNTKINKKNLESEILALKKKIYKKTNKIQILKEIENKLKNKDYLEICSQILKFNKKLWFLKKFNYIKEFEKFNIKSEENYQLELKELKIRYNLNDNDLLGEINHYIKKYIS